MTTRPSDVQEMLNRFNAEPRNDYLTYTAYVQAYPDHTALITQCAKLRHLEYHLLRAAMFGIRYGTTYSGGVHLPRNYPIQGIGFDLAHKHNTP